MSKSLVIVESPKKTRSLSQWLGKDYIVEASMGHIIDLPANELGVRLKDYSFTPTYRIIRGKKKILERIKTQAKKTDTILICTDPDREGEMIGYQVASRLGKNKTIKRARFNEITRTAVLTAINSLTDIDTRLINSQQARRILDRLVGYLISPLLPRVFGGGKGLSAGRVQSVALRLICERQQEIESFVPTEYWTIDALLTKEISDFKARLQKRSGKKLEVPDEAAAQNICQELKAEQFIVKKVAKKERKRYPYPPFTTSQLQQQAGNVLHWSSRKTMHIAQQLYEGVEIPGENEPVGLITYHRTDSVRISNEGIQHAREFILHNFGSKYLPSKPNTYKERSRNVQAGHEAIRPTSLKYTPNPLEPVLSKDLYKLYKLIFERFVSSQMVPAILDTTTVDINAGRYLFRASGSTVKFDGFTRIYEVSEEKEEEEEDKKEKLPSLEAGDTLVMKKLLPEQHFTKPKPKYTDASLVRMLEEEGIGRPSTYAAIISTLLDRKYVIRENRRFEPTALGKNVCDWLVRNFPRIMDVKFTANMEEKLDLIENGHVNWSATLKEFFDIFQETLNNVKEDLHQPKSTEIECEVCTATMILKTGRYGPYITCEKDSSHPKISVSIGKDGAITIRSRQQVKPVGKKCPQCGGELVERTGRYGPYIACSNFSSQNCTYKESLKKEARTSPRSTGIQCPECEGELVERRARRTGRLFWGCNGFPKCRYTTWKKPDGQSS